MGIVSYAQNFEDVILWRALGHIPNGTYLDVGAHHPDIDSVSKAFYDHGWRGVHVEPGPIVAQLLRDKRPGDIVVQAIVSDETGVMPFYETPGGGLSTADLDVAKFHLDHGHAPVAVTSVVSVTLDDILDQVPGNEIHWMKIDVEGFERKVLLSWRTSKRRPWIIVIEATYPKTRTATHDQWEDIVLSKGYRFAYDDGLNRFYLSDAHSELSERLIQPPNIFDEFQINPSGGSVFSQDMKTFMESAIFARDDRIAQLEAEREQIRSDAGAHVAKLEAEREQIRSDADAHVARLEAELAQARTEQRKCEADIAAMRIAMGELCARNANMRALLARLLADCSRPWPLRTWYRHGSGSALGGLLILPDNEFIEGAYRALLGREPDATGKAHYLAKLERGRKRSWLLDDLASSDEARAYASGSDLADLADDAFVEAAYRRTLGRACDVEGRAHYVERLEGGLARAELMRILRDSPEGCKCRDGLWHEIDDLVRRRRSLLGWRTWLHADPLPPLDVGPGDVMTEILGRKHDLPVEVGQSAAAEWKSAPSGAAWTEDLRRLQDKIGLLAAVIEGVSARR